jgi:hypothetical protein
MKKALKFAGEKIIVGLLYGIGFGIPAGAIYYYVTDQMMASVYQESQIGKVVVTKHEEVIRGQNAIILGEVKNQGTDSVRNIAVEVDLYDKNGSFVEQCSTYLRGTIPAGDSRTFKVTCGDCKKDGKVVEHQTYKVRVTGL